MVAPPADLRHGFSADRPLEAHLLSDLSLRTIEGACSRLLPTHLPSGSKAPQRQLAA